VHEQLSNFFFAVFKSTKLLISTLNLIFFQGFSLLLLIFN